MKATSLETNRRGKSYALAKEITLQETQGLKDVILKMMVITAGIALAMYIAFMMIRINTLEAEYDGLQDKYAAQTSDYNALSNSIAQTEAQYNSTILSLKSNIASSNNVIETLNTEVSSLMADNKSLASEYDELLGEYNVLATREELYDKYSYVVMYGGKRTDVTYDQIKMGEELMLEEGYDPDILFSIIMVESRGNENAKNSASTARGYGQFLKGTGKFTYEELMYNGKGTYDHSMALNGTTNIEMMANYLNYLLDNHNGNIFSTIVSYRGRGGSIARNYMAAMNSFSSKAGASIYN